MVNQYQVALALFCGINTLICFWEIALFFYIEHIHHIYSGLRKKVPRGQIGRIFFFESARLSDAFSLKYWSELWAVYSLVDESYSDSKSFGFNIDIGNGFSMLIPTIVFTVGMTNHALMSPKHLGLVGMVSFYQEFYGTVVYFTQYVVNRRWRNHGNSLPQIVAMVGMPNIIWIIFPSLGMYCSYRLIMEESFQVFL